MVSAFEWCATQLNKRIGLVVIAKKLQLNAFSVCAQENSEIKFLVCLVFQTHLHPF